MEAFRKTGGIKKKYQVQRLTAVINTHEYREVTIVDIQNAFIQTNNTNRVGDQRYIIKIGGKLTHILVDISTEVYGPNITYENGKAVLYLELLKQ